MVLWVIKTDDRALSVYEQFWLGVCSLISNK